jgi:hypothetical protein
MTVKTQGINQNEFLLSEAEGQRSRSQVIVTVAGGVLLPSGTVLGKITATGKYVKALDASSDGSQTAVAVLSTRLDGADVANGDYQAVVYDTDCEVIGSLLNGGAGPDTTSVAELRAVGIKVR